MSDTEANQLRKDQVEALWEIEQRGGVDEVEIVSADAVERVREVLGEALKERGLTDSSTLKLESLANQFQDEDGDDLLVGMGSNELEQAPETAGASNEEIVAEDDDPEGVDALSAEERQEVRDKLERAEKFDSRIPKHCETLRQEAVGLVPGVEDVDDIDTDRL